MVGRVEAFSARLRIGREAAPHLTLREAYIFAQRIHLSGGKQVGMVARVTNGRKHPALECVGEHHSRTSQLVGAGEGVSQHGEVVAPEVTEQSVKLVIIPPADEAR